MNRFTYKEPSGIWGVHGENIRDMSQTIYGAMTKLLDYEETGLNPDAVGHMKDDAEKIHIGSSIQGYEVCGIYKEICIAYNRRKHDYVVWHIDADKCGVYGGSYYDNEQDAERHFIELAFSGNWQPCHWIDCSEQLPPEPSSEFDDLTEYLVIIRGFEPSTALSYAGGGVWMDTVGSHYDVESWMPMPARR